MYRRHVPAPAEVTQMIDRVSADVVVVFHLLFIAFAILGGLLVLRWRWVMGLHLPAVAWAVLVEVMSWPCPLTPLENHFRRRAGRGGYEGGFVEHYLIPVIYPAGLTDEIQFLIGAFVFTVNAVVYSFVVAKWVRTKREPEQEASAEVAFVRD